MVATPRSRALPASVAALALGLTAACGGGGPEGTEDDPIELRFAWWGGDERAELTEEVIDLFEAEYPHIRVQPSITTDFAEYWETMATETAGGGGADVIQMDYSYLQQYYDRGLLTDLNEYVDDGTIDTGDFREGMVETGEVAGEQSALPIGSNTIGLFYRPGILEEAGVDAPDGSWDWAGYTDAIAEISEAGVADDMYGAEDYTNEYHFMEVWLRQQGKNFYTDDGQLNFTEEELVEWWSLADDLRDDDLVVPPDTIEETEPLSTMGANLVATRLQWDNFLFRFADELGEDGEDVALANLPTDDPDASGQYLKPSMMLSVNTQSDFPEEAALFVDFFLNDPEANAVIGAERGIPATESGVEAADLAGIDAQIYDYEEGLADLIGDPPPPPPAAAGSVEQVYRDLHEQISYGQLTLEEAAEQFFSEAEDHIEQSG